MKNTLTRTAIFIIIFFTLQGCVATLIALQEISSEGPDNFQDRERISNFPSRPGAAEPQFFFPGEAQPDQPYIQTHLFEVRGPGNAPYPSLVEEMRFRARRAGVDAVIIMGKELVQRWDYSDRLREYQQLSGLGVIFKENVDYLHNYRYVNQLYVWNAEKDTFELAANLFPDFDNQIFEVQSLEKGVGNYYYENFIKIYSYEFLVEQKGPQWKERIANNGFITRRNYQGENNLTANLQLNYEPGTGRLNHIKGKFFTRLGGTEWQDIYFTHDTQGKITGKRVLEKGKPELREVLVYDEWDRLITSHWYQVSEAGEVPFLKVEYYYYSNEDVYTMF